VVEGRWSVDRDLDLVQHAGVVGYTTCWCDMRMLPGKRRSVRGRVSENTSDEKTYQRRSKELPLTVQDHKEAQQVS